jgi:DNA-directed RNA polymerase specialized sigma24 family protein
MSPVLTDQLFGSLAGDLADSDAAQVARAAQGCASAGKQDRRRQSGAGAAPTLLSDDSSATDEMDRIADPSEVALESVWQEEWDKHLMTAALEQVKRLVSPRQYQMFDLHVLQNLSVPDTARTVQTSVASVYMAKYRVRRLLKAEIRRSRRRPNSKV